MASFNQNLQSVAKARNSIAKAKSAFDKAKINLHKKNPSFGKAEVSAKLGIKERAEQTAKENLQRSVQALYASDSPQALIANWDAKVPILLMPLRLETRFMDSGGTQELWLRIYPDDIAVQQHERLLTEKEFSEGKKYWEDLFEAGKTGEGGDDQKKALWEGFRNLFGANRSEWVARQTVPVNWSDKVTLDTKENLVFPEMALFKSGEWTQAPRTQILPDKFVVSIFKNNNKVYEQLGNLVPDTLFLGHDPLLGGDAFTKTDFGIEFAKEFSWMSDFEEAVKLGMGLKITLKNEFYSDVAKRVIDQVTVLGVFLSADGPQSASVLNELLEDHRYTEGLAIIPQGTPTNNTGDASSGFIPNEDPQPNGYFDIAPIAPFQNDPLCDGNRFVSALGISPSVIEGISKDTCRDHAEAVIMNNALFPATIGYYFDTLLDKYVDDKFVLLLRTFFENHVTGAGSLPAIRIGDQPYGILVTSDFSKWKTIAPDQDHLILYDYILKVLGFFSSEWEAQSKKVLYVGRERNEQNNLLTAEDIFLDIVGLEPSSIKFERRLGFLNDLPAINKSGLDLLTKFNLEASSNETLIHNAIKSWGGIALPGMELFSGLLFKPENKVFIPEKNLVDGLPVSEIRPLGVITQIGKDYLSWLATASSILALEKQDFSGAKAPNYLLYLLGRHSLLLEVRREALKILNKRNGKIDRSAFDKTYLNFNGISAATRDLTIWEVLNADISKIEQIPPGPLIKFGDKLIKQESGPIKDLKSSFASLSLLPTARLERLLTSHLDCLTYRLDAWQSGLFSERLESRRNDAANPVKGIYLGAFGYLENLMPAPKTLINPATLPPSLQPPDGKPIFAAGNSAGILHAPSLDHAAAAAVLMAGYRNHATPQEPGVFSVNLSSSRIRKAVQVLEGVRNGQSLESLLGYLFERGCHDKNLNQFILAFRAKYPIENQYNKQEGDPDNSEIYHTVEPNVVNGLKIAKEKNLNNFRAIIDQVPGADQHAYDTVVIEAGNLADTLDAIKDLLLSESVFQAVSGNSARTGVVLESLREGSVPPDPGILKTPRRSRFAFKHLVSIHFPQDGGTISPWGDIPLSPRSQFEPGLNLWLSEIFGKPENIVCSVGHIDESTSLPSTSTKVTLADLKIQPVDFLLFSGKDIEDVASELHRRISFYYRSLTNLPPHQEVNIDFSGETGGTNKSFDEILPLAKSLHSVLSQSRAVHAGDYMPLVPERSSVSNNKNGYDIADIRNRIGTSLQSLDKILQQLDEIVPNNEPKNEANPANLNLLFKQWETENFSDTRFSDFSVDGEVIKEIIGLRTGMAGFDIPTAWPVNIPEGAQATTAGFLAETAQLWRAAHLQLENAKLIFEQTGNEENLEDQAGMLSKVAKFLLGASFPVMPKFNYQNAGDINLAAKDQKQLLTYYSSISGLPDAVIPDDWFQSVSEVRSKTAGWEMARSLAEIHGNADLSLSPIQLPYREKDSWLAVQFPEKDELTGGTFGISTDTISCAVVGKEAFDTASLQSGLLIDEWSETIPVDTETSGIAFNYDQPGTMPPQAMLLAVYPGTENSWNWDTLLGTVMDTFARARMRAVEPRHLIANQLIYHFLPGVIAPVNIAGGNISLDFAVASDEFLNKLPTGISLYDPHLSSVVH